MQNKTRSALFVGSAVTVLAALVFMWFLNLNEPVQTRQLLLKCLWILGGISTGALGLFFWKGPVFQEDGRVEGGYIMSMLVTLLVIMELGFAFAIYAQKNQVLRTTMNSQIRTTIAAVEDAGETADLELIRQNKATPYVTNIHLLDETLTVRRSSQAAAVGQSVPQTDAYTFPYFGGWKIQFVVNHQYFTDQLWGVVLNLVTVLLISLFFTVEIVWLMLKLTLNAPSRRLPSDQNLPAAATALTYVRQIAFLFYFGSRLSASFIPIMAKNLNPTFTNISPNMGAALPQSAETLLTCAAIFITTEILTRKGWKLPFAAGLLLVSGGTLLSAFSGTLLQFVLARAVVGLGYGFCWMTLRNLALFGRDAQEQSWGFSMLNAGLYAGMNCGSALGAILAEHMGYVPVFLLAAGLTLLCSVLILFMENRILPKAPPKEARKDSTYGLTLWEKLHVGVFALLMIAPSCIAASYLSYFLPLYFENLGRSVTDVGRAQLVYGLVIVYIGPQLSHWLSRSDRVQFRANYLYSLLFSGGLLLVGALGGVVPAMLAVLCLGLGDSFGFSVQNNYFLSLPPVRQLGASKSLSYLSFLKKMTEMLGPTVFALVLVMGYEKGMLVLGVVFLLAAVLFLLWNSSYAKKEIQLDRIGG